MNNDIELIQDAILDAGGPRSAARRRHLRGAQGR